MPQSVMVFVVLKVAATVVVLGSTMVERTGTVIIVVS